MHRRTRREVLGGAGAVASAALAGCTGSVNPIGDDGEDEETYTVEMEPVGEVSFASVPERWFPYTTDYADMGVALGVGDGLLAVELRERFAVEHYEELPDVAVDRDDLTDLWQDGTDKELFYELDADVHLIDPHFMINQVGWEEEDVEEIAENVAPFLGNSIFSQSYDWHDYPYYSLYEAFEHVAAVFQEEDRYAAFADLHDEVLGDIGDRLPGERPDIAILAPDGPDPDAFWGYTLDGGTQTKQFEDLEVGDALEKSGVGGYHETGGTIDYETLLEVDPDAIVIWQESGVTADTFTEDILEPMQDHEVARNLRAVEDGRVIFGGIFYQGPIINLFQLEMAAHGLYPDTFGDEELFDRSRVNDIVTGDI